MNIKKYPIKKILIIVFIVLVSAYVVWDITMKVINHFRVQGYGLAIIEMAKQAENEECAPFNIFVEDKRIDLINISCLQQASDTNDSIITEDDLNFDEIENDIDKNNE